MPSYASGGEIPSPTYDLSSVSCGESPSSTTHLSLPLNHLFLWDKGMISLGSFKNGTEQDV